MERLYQTTTLEKSEEIKSEIRPIIALDYEEYRADFQLISSNVLLRPYGCWMRFFFLSFSKSKTRSIRLELNSSVSSACSLLVGMGSSLDAG